MVVGKEKLDHSSPTIIIANHPASFLDAMVLAVFLGRPLHFYVRGDIFSHPLARWVLSRLHMIPIYSIEHGLNNLAKNKNTFDRGQQLLNDGNMLLIFPEGFSRFSKELAPFKKGAARVALQTAFDHQFKGALIIQTVSINYSFHGFRSILNIRVGESMEISGYKESYLSTPNHAIAALNKDMMNLFEKNVIHIKQGNRTSFVERLGMLMLSNERNGEIYFARFRQLCEYVSSLNEDDFNSKKDNLNTYEELLKKSALTNDAMQNEKAFSLLKYLLLFISFPLFLIGFMLWHIIYIVSKKIADNTVTREDFYTSVFCGVLGVLGFIWWIAISCIALSLDIFPVFVIAVLSPFMYMLSLYWMEAWKKMLTFFRMKRLIKREKKEYDNLLSAREFLRDIQ
jgi:1-acyl-sn-glycerol-3-phosphate acyltransferase